MRTFGKMHLMPNIKIMKCIYRNEIYANLMKLFFTLCDGVKNVQVYHQIKVIWFLENCMVRF